MPLGRLLLPVLLASHLFLNCDCDCNTFNGDRLMNASVHSIAIFSPRILSVIDSSTALPTLLLSSHPAAACKGRLLKSGAHVRFISSLDD